MQKAEKLIVAALKRMKMRQHPKVPLTHRAGNVTCRLQNVRYRNLRQRQANVLSQTSGRRTGVELVAKTLLVAPRRQPGTRRTAHRTRNVSVRETHTPPRDRINIRRRNVLATVAADVGITHIVADDNDNIRPSPFRPTRLAHAGTARQY